MDIKTFNLINRLPDYIPASLNANKGNSAVLSSLLETYTKNGTITFEESNILYTHFMSDDDSPIQTRTEPQPEPQQQSSRPNPQPANTAPSSQKIAGLKNDYRRVRNEFIVFLIILIMISPFSFVAISASTSESTAFPAGNLAHCVDTVEAENDYLIKDAELYGSYAEFFMTKENNYFVEEDDKSSIDDLYLAVVTDNDGAEHLTSISVERSSALGAILKNHDFDTSAYTLSGYFTARSLSSHKNEITGETAQDYLNQTLDTINVSSFDVLRWDFEYLFPETADYAEEKGKTDTNRIGAIIIGVIIFAVSLALLVVTVKKGKKKSELKKELNRLGIK